MPPKPQQISLMNLKNIPYEKMEKKDLIEIIERQKIIIDNMYEIQLIDSKRCKCRFREKV